MLISLNPFISFKGFALLKAVGRPGDGHAQTGGIIQGLRLHCRGQESLAFRTSKTPFKTFETPFRHLRLARRSA